MNYLLQSEVKATHFTMCNIQNVSRKYTQLEIHTQHENETCKNKNEESKKPWQVTVIEPQLFQMQVCWKQRKLTKMDQVEPLAQGKYHR